MPVALCGLAQRLLTGVRVDVYVRPGSSRPRVGGQYGEALVVRVTPRAVDGKATEAALCAVADALGVPRRDVALVSGATSRRKVVEVPDDTLPRLEALRSEVEKT